MFTKKSAKKINKILVGSLLAVGMFVSASGGLLVNFNKSNNNIVYAASVESIDKTSSFISNYDFNSTLTSKTPPMPSNWTEINDNIQTPTNLVAGVFNTYEANQKTDEDYLSNYKLLKSPGHATNQETLASTNPIYKNFMINSATQPGRKGYESSAFTLEKDSYYLFKVVLKTVTEINSDNPLNSDKNYADFDSRASIYLVDENDTTLISFENVDSSLGEQITNGYSEYKFYVSTNTYTSTKANLQLYLGSKDESFVGPVFFNSVKVSQISQKRFEYETQGVSESDQNTKVLNMASKNVENIMQNPSFELDWQTGWNLIEGNLNLNSDIQTVSANNINQSNAYINANLSAKDVPNTNNTSSSNNNILIMYSNDDNAIGIESEEITIKQHSRYKLNVWSWCNSGKGAGTIKLVDKSDRKLPDVSVTTSTVVSTSSTSLTNGWTKHSFYINGDPYKDVTVAIQLWLGTESSNVSGYVYFDDITMQALSYENYTSAKNSNVMDYNTADSFLISNSTFNIAENADATSTYPLIPTDWTANVSNYYAKSGVVNIADQNFNSDDLRIDENAGPAKPQALPGDSNSTSNNVLMIASSDIDNSQSYTSKAVSLSDTYYVLTAYYHAVNGGVSIKLLDGENYIYNLTNLSSNGWQKVEFAIKKGAFSPSLQVELSLSGVSGYAYFDEIELLASNETYFNSLSTSNYVKKIDLTNYDFENTFDDGQEVLPLNYFQESTAKDNSFSGIVNLNRGYAGLIETDPNNKYAMVVTNYTADYYYVENLNEITLDANTYYAISVTVKTHDLSSESQNYGANILLSGQGLNKAFSNINTNTQWETYTFYVKSTTATTASLQLGLGNEDELCKGIALFDNITIQSLTDKSEFDLATIGKENSDYAIIINSTDTQENTSDEAEEETTDPATLWFVLPSLISAIALVAAIIVSFVRKINWKKRGKKVKTSYDRKKTVEKDLDRREKIALRQQMINELEIQLKELNEEIEAYVSALDEHNNALKEKLAKEHQLLLDRKSKTTAEKEEALRARNAKIAENKKAFTAKEEEEFSAYIKKLEIKEAKEQKAVIEKEISIKKAQERKDAKLAKYLQRQEFIRKEIERIDKEIEEIAREEAQIWEEYKLAKQEAKARKAEYKKQLKEQKAVKQTLEKSAKKSNNSSKNKNAN